MKKSEMLINRSTWGNGPHKGRPAVDHIARIPLGCSYDFHYRKPLGALVESRYYERGRKTVPLREVNGLIRKWEISVALTGDQWALYQEMYPR